MSIDEVIQVALTFVPRYFLLLCLPFLPLGAVIAAIAIKSHTLSVLQSPGGRFGVLVYISIVGLFGTLFVPGLEFSPRKVSQAFPIELRMLAREWPGNWWYVVVQA